MIQNERRIEMAFEEQRYWDIRRWRIAEEIFKNPLEGLEIMPSGGSPIFVIRRMVLIIYTRCVEETGP